MNYVCSKCGAPLNDGAKFCVVCGARAEVFQKSFCTNCGAEMNPGARFCVNCGMQAEEEPVAAVQPEQPKVCPKCGAPLIAGSKFCVKCGADIAINAVNMAKKIFQHQTAASPYPGETLCSVGQVGDMQLSALINAVRH